MSFFKLDHNITTSSLWSEEADVVKVWLYLLLEADPKGVVRTTTPAIALHNGLPLARVREILQKFAAPDPHSRTAANEGRRVRIDREPQFAITLLNYEAYRYKDHTHAARQARYRQRLRSRGKRDAVTPSRDAVTPRHVTNEDEDEEEKTRYSSAARAADAPTPELTPRSTPTGGRKPGKAGKRATNPDSRRLVDHYVTEFSRLFGGPPIVQAADAVAAPRILAGRTLDDARALVTAALQDDDAWRRERGLYRLRDLPLAITKLLAKKNGKHRESLGGEGRDFGARPPDDVVEDGP